MGFLMSKLKHCDICGKELKWHDFKTVIGNAPIRMTTNIADVYTYGKIYLCLDCSLKNHERPYALDAKAYNLRGTNIYG